MAAPLSKETLKLRGISLAYETLSSIIFRGSPADLADYLPIDPQPILPEHKDGLTLIGLQTSSWTTMMKDRKSFEGNVRGLAPLFLFRTNHI
jgi:hypothetical protein